MQKTKDLTLTATGRSIPVKMKSPKTKKKLVVKITSKAAKRITQRNRKKTYETEPMMKMKNSVKVLAQIGEAILKRGILSKNKMEMMKKKRKRRRKEKN